MKGDTEEVRQHSQRSGMAVEQVQLETKLKSLRNWGKPGDRESIALPTWRATTAALDRYPPSTCRVTLTLISLKGSKELFN